MQLDERESGKKREEVKHSGVRIGASGGAGPVALFVALQMGKLKQTRWDRSAAFKPIWLY